MSTRSSPRRAGAKSRLQEEEGEGEQLQSQGYAEGAEEAEEEAVAVAEEKPAAKKGKGGRRAKVVQDEEDEEGGEEAGGEARSAGKKGGAVGAVEMDKYDEETIKHARETNRRNKQIESSVPQVCKDLPCMLGIDEAGRGPVCGPMVYGIAFCPISELAALKKLGFADSKTLNEDQRERLFKVIKASEAFLGWITTVLSPAEISHGMLGRQNYNLNALSHDTAIALIRKCIDAGVNVAEVYLDTVGKPEAYRTKLEKIFPNLKIVVESKADATYPIVSAASICAKVTRDRVVDHWQHMEKRTPEISLTMGSGYPGDPATKKWLAEHLDTIFGFPGVVRFAWSTAANVIKEKCAVACWEDDGSEEDEEGETAKPKSKAKKLTTFFAKKDAPTPVARHRFFQERYFQRVTDF